MKLSRKQRKGLGLKKKIKPIDDEANYSLVGYHGFTPFELKMTVKFNKEKEDKNRITPEDPYEIYFDGEAVPEIVSLMALLAFRSAPVPAYSYIKWNGKTILCNENEISTVLIPMKCHYGDFHKLTICVKNLNTGEVKQIKHTDTEFELPKDSIHSVFQMPLDFKWLRENPRIY